MNRDNQNDELVILIHGTYAGDESDEGPRWWQRGSNIWQTFENKLPNGIALAPVFHWGKGPNSTRGRLSAAINLLETLKNLEQLDQDYHLVAHSHGGNVIRECLKQALIKRKYSRRDTSDKDLLQLKHLRSWTTVGTPFMIYRLSMTPFGKSRFYTWCWQLKMMVQKSMSKLRFIDYIQSIFLLFILLMITFLMILVWIYYPFTFQSIFFTALVLFLLIMFVFSGMIESQMEHMQFHRENFANQAVADEFGGRWLGLYSKDDEAIKGLKSTINIALNIVPERTLENEVFYSDRIFRWLRPIRQIIYQLYNRIVPPVGNQFISMQIARSAQGNDRPGTDIEQITESPLPDDKFIRPLPESINTHLIESANNNAKEMVPELRKMLGSLLSSGLNMLEDEQIDLDVSTGLIHNNYFDNNDVIDLIIWHITKHSKVKTAHEKLQLEPHLVEWVQGFI